MVSALSVRSIEHTYPGGIRALARVDLEIEAGELVCVLGPNGSGKSTLLSIAGGLFTPDAGEVLLEGRPLAKTSARERARLVSRVPQALRALPETRVETFLLGGRYAHQGFFGRTRPGDLEAVGRALAEVEAGDWSERLLTELSGGERQRVLVARALAQEARVLLLDEPTTSLDPEHQVVVFELLRRLAREGRAVGVATHELTLASRFADRVQLLDGGRVAATGRPEEVLRREVLEPVYGPHLLIADAPGATGRPLVVPWPRAPE